MNPEQFHDALNYLDDDLIEQTDELRQGRRMLRTRPAAMRVMAWAAPAACLALVIGLAPRFLPAMETGDAAVEQEVYGENKSPGEVVHDFQIIDNAGTTRQESVSSADWETVSCGALTVSIPENWTWEQEAGEDGGYCLVIRPPYEDGAIRVGYDPVFGVCGTGLTTEEMTIAGKRAHVGTYDGGRVWSFITFPDETHWYVVINDGADTWWGVYGDTVMEMLETIVIAEKE